MLEALDLASASGRRDCERPLFLFDSLFVAREFSCLNCNQAVLVGSSHSATAIERLDWVRCSEGKERVGAAPLCSFPLPRFPN